MATSWLSIPPRLRAGASSKYTGSMVLTISVTVCAKKTSFHCASKNIMLKKSKCVTTLKAIRNLP